MAVEAGLGRRRGDLGRVCSGPESALGDGEQRTCVAPGSALPGRYPPPPSPLFAPRSGGHGWLVFRLRPVCEWVGPGTGRLFPVPVFNEAL